MDAPDELIGTRYTIYNVRRAAFRISFYPILMAGGAKYGRCLSAHGYRVLEFLFSSSDGKSSVYLSGPASVPRSLAYTAGGEYWGIVLKAHVFMPSLAKKDILNLNFALPMKGSRSFVFDNDLFDVPTYETAEDFIAQLAEGRHIVANHVVAKALNGASWMAPRTAQRHVADTTGLTRKRMASIRRAQEAFSLLQKGMTIPEVIVAVGYVDQSHLTKSLKLLAGQTPAQILAMHADQ